MRFYAANAFKQVLLQDVAKKHVRPGIKTVITCLLNLMNEFDNEELVVAFENIMTIFSANIGPFAVEICQHLKEQYIRLIKQDQEENDWEEGESIMAALASLQSIRRVINCIQKDTALLAQIEPIIYPVLLHSVTIDGLDSIEEGLDCITMLLFFAYKNKEISEQLWKIFPQLLFITVGSENDGEGGAGFEFVSQVVNCLKNYFAKDPQGCKKIGPEQDKTYLHQTFYFIKRCLEVNRNGKHFMDGVSVMSLIISILENMQGMLDKDEFPFLVQQVLTDLDHVRSKGSNAKQYKLMLL